MLMLTGFADGFGRGVEVKGRKEARRTSRLLTRSGALEKEEEIDSYSQKSNGI